jgi:hypothetical protein
MDPSDDHVATARSISLLATTTMLTAFAMGCAAQRPFDAVNLRTGQFTYRTLVDGEQVGGARITIDKLDGPVYRFRNEVTGAFHQTWEATATPSFQPLAASLGLGPSDDASISMQLAYDGSSVSGTATKRNPSSGAKTEQVRGAVPGDIVDQRIDWAAVLSGPLVEGRTYGFSVFDPWTGVSRVAVTVGPLERVVVPAGTFQAYRVVYRMNKKARGTETFQVLASKEAPHMLVREDFPSGAITELVAVAAGGAGPTTKP